MNSHHKIADITFIGSGISTSFSILHLLDLISDSAPQSKVVLINIIDKYPEFHVGIPYGQRSGFSTLLITSLKNFLIEPELSLFINWLNQNKDWLLEAFKKEGGLLSEKWLATHNLEIQKNQWEDLFIPRRFFGCYMEWKVKSNIKELTDKGQISVNFIHGEVVDLEKSENFSKIVLKDHSNIISKKVVLSLGSLPTKNLWVNRDLVESKEALFLNNPYQPELNVNLNKIHALIKNRTNETTNILIVGSNASALEVLYKINDLVGDFNTNTKFTFLSTQGKIPDAIIDKVKQNTFIPKNLDHLKNQKELTAKHIAEAAFKDLDQADQINLGPASSIEIMSKYIANLLNKLDYDELEIFACKYGNDIGKRQRCAGLHYAQVATHLMDLNRFEHLSGRFSDLETTSNGTFSLQYIETETNKKINHHEPFNIVINCIGSHDFYSENIPELYKHLINKKYGIPNGSAIGFHVNESLEASKNLYVMGPLLAGNVIENRAVWHVEHCGRIIWISKILAQILADELQIKKKDSSKKYQLDIVCLDFKEKIEAYKSLIKEKWHNNIYYAYDHLKYFENEQSTLKYVTFKINDVVKIAMPMVLRKIDLPDKPLKCYDVINPYGYSGPLYDDDVTESDLKEFWKNLDDWYHKNNVITEFIRFSLNKNYTAYSGLLISSLLNIKGTFYNDFEKQWASFLPKVRNNYRKAVSHNLRFKIFNNHEINEEHIEDFYDIYTQTMLRNHANKLYFFPLNYFKNLIFNNTNECALAFAYHEKKYISAEFIIKNNETIYAFLGGTDSNYYHLRPNDFLRVEIIKWAIQEHFKHYVLGGGLENFDGLYKSKKAFFPKNEDVIFYTGRKIIDYDTYDDLCKKHTPNYKNIYKEELVNYFFPLYRFINS